MQFHLQCERVTIGVFLAATIAMAGASDTRIIGSIKTMENALGLTITEPSQLGSRIRRSQQIPANYSILARAISPDGTAIAWWAGNIFAAIEDSGPVANRGDSTPFLTVESLKEGKQPVWVEGRVAAAVIGISSGAEVIVAIARPSIQRPRWELLAIDRRSGLVVHNLTPFVTQFKLGEKVGDINVSGPGTLLALGQSYPEQIQVLEIASGKSIYAGPGRCPHLSPDGKRLAFVDNDELWIHSFADDSTAQSLKGTRVKGVGGWSPDGRFLLAGAWTTEFAFEKRQIIIDTSTGEYAVKGKLGEGDYGCEFAWVSVKLLEQ